MAASFFHSTRLPAVTNTWTNVNGGSWNDIGNWLGGIPGGAASIADFSTLALSSSQTVTLDANQAVGGLIFGDFSGVPANDWTLANGAGGPWALTLSIASGSPVINVVNRSATILATLGGTSGFTKTGAGILVLAAANSYSGATIVSGGKLVLDFSQATSPATNIINPASTLTLAGGNVTVIGAANTSNSQTFAGLTLNAGVSSFVAGANAAANPVLISLGGITRNVGAVVDFAQPTGTISATNGFTTSTANSNGGILGGWATVGGTTWASNNGSNIVGLTSAGYTTTTSAGTNAANYTDKDVDVTQTRALAGAVSINSLRFNNPSAFNFTLAASTVNVISSGGILVTSAVGAKNSTIAGGVTATLEGAAGKDLVVIQNNTAGLLIINAVIADNSTATGLTKAGAGTLQISKAATYTGGTRILAGTILLNVNQGLVSGGAVILGDAGTNSGGILDLNTFNQNIGALSAVGGGQNVITNSGASSSTLTISAASTFNGIIQDGTGGMSVVKSGGSVVTLSGANTFTGLFQINSGTVKLIGGDNRISTNGSLSLGNGTTGTGILQLGDASAASNQTLTSLVITAGNSSLTNQITGGNATHTSTLTLNIATANLYQGLLGNGTAGNTAANNLALVKTGDGVLTLGRPAAATTSSTYTGGTTINQGTLALGSSGALPLGGTVTVSGGALDLAGFNNPVGPVVLSSGSMVDTVGGGMLSGSSYDVRSGTISAALGDGASASSLTKSTAGLVTISSANAYTGATTITAGTLSLTASGVIASNVTISSGGAFINSGTVNAAINVQPGAALFTTETSTTGLSILNGSLTLNNGADWYFDLGGASRGAALDGYDAVNGLTQLTLSGTLHLNLINGYAPEQGDTFNLLDWTQLSAPGSVGGTGFSFDFTNASLGSGLTWDTSSFLSSGSISVIAATAPEPHAALLMAMGGASMLLRRRR